MRHRSRSLSIDSESSERRIDAPGSDLVQHAFDELRLDGNGLAGQLGEALDRPDDRRARGLAVEPVEPERVREEAGNPACESVELGQRVLAQRDENVDPAGTRSSAGSARRRTQAQRRPRDRGSTPRPGRARGTRPVRLALGVEREPLTALGAPRASAPRIVAPAREDHDQSGSSGSSRSERATAARRSDDLPTPLGP